MREFIFYDFRSTVIAQNRKHKYGPSQENPALFSGYGSGVFGTYLLEQILRDRLFFLLEKWVYIIPEYFACWLWIGVCVLCGIVITNLLKCIPGVRKYL